VLQEPTYSLGPRFAAPAVALRCAYSGPMRGYQLCVGLHLSPERVSGHKLAKSNRSVTQATEATDMQLTTRVGADVRMQDKAA